MRTSGSLSPHVPRVPSLDGLRAISILFVLLAHLAGTTNFPLSAHAVLGLVDLGRLGVRVFFVISGLLITGLLLREYEKTGRLDLATFFLKRTFRIFPAYYTYVTVIAIAGALGWIQLNDGDLLHAFTYTMNYHTGQSWNMGHAWTLSVEEQFYLLWPTLLLFFGFPGAFRAAAVFLLLASVVRVTLYVLPKELTGRITEISGQSFETVGDALATGCLLANIREKLWGWPRWRAFINSPLFWLIPLMVIIAAMVDRMHVRQLHEAPERTVVKALLHFVSVPTMNIGIAICIEWAIRNAGGMIGRLLNMPIMVHIGALSYSLYLWQQPFLNRRNPTWYTSFPLNLLLVFIAAYASFFLVEKPMLKLRPMIIRNLRHHRFFQRAKVSISVAGSPVEDSAVHAIAPESLKGSNPQTAQQPDESHD